MDFQQVALAICGATATYVWYKRFCALSITDVPGPKNPSWTYGHRWWWECEQMSVPEKRLLEEYGTVVRWNGTLGQECLWVADPKAIHHIIQAACYEFEKAPNNKAHRELLMGRGLVLAEGEVHKRQRRAMTPAFGLVEVKSIHPSFARWSDSLADKWHETILNAESGQAAVIDISSWLSKATLDAIGAAAFDYHFGALENSDNKFTKSYQKLTFHAFGKLNKGQLLMMDVLRLAPKRLVTWRIETDQRPGMVRVRENRTYAREVAAKLVQEKRRELKNGASQKDVLTLLVKANSSLRPDWRLDEEEIIAQVQTIMFAGHETTSKTLTFALWELAKNRHTQETLRKEVEEKLRKIRSEGGDDFTPDDFNSMPYLLAVVKETLRIHPTLGEIQRVPLKNTVLPLAKPIVGVSGKVYEELPVPAGTLINVSILGYNLNEDLWGTDAHEFQPERWLGVNKRPESSFGVYGNLATFSGGPRSCIGWRFAVVELHTFLVKLVRTFDFSLPEGGQEINWTRAGAPVMVGEEHKGPQLPLKVTALRNE